MNYHIDQLLNETHQTPVRRHGIYYTLSIFQQALHEHASQGWMRSELYWAYLDFLLRLKAEDSYAYHA